MKTLSEKVDFLKKCDTSFIGDAFIRLGLGEKMQEYAIPGAKCGPLNRTDRFSGVALTVRFAVPERGAATWDLFDIIEKAEAGSVLAMCGCEGRCHTGDVYVKYAELMGMAAFVTDGMIRDIADISSSGLPVFCRGGTTAAKGGTGAKIVAQAEPISLCGVGVRTGDVLVGDADGIIVIPPDLLDDVVFQAEEIKELEAEYLEAFDLARKDPGCVKSGELLASLRAIAKRKAFRRERA